jgi:hypothetical protein
VPAQLSPSRVRAGLLTFAALATAGAAALVPAAASAKAPRCGQQRGTQVLRTASFRITAKVVTIDYGDSIFRGRQFYSCALPGGLVHTIGKTGTFFISDGAGHPQREFEIDHTSFAPPAGPFVLRRNAYSGCADESNCEDGVKLDVVDLRTGHKRYGLAADTDAVAVAKLDPSGRLVALVADPVDADDPDPAAPRRLLGFTAQGRKTTLDRGPAADLPAADVLLKGASVTWTKAGVAKSATLG